MVVIFYFYLQLNKCHGIRDDHKDGWGLVEEFVVDSLKLSVVGKSWRGFIEFLNFGMFHLYVMKDVRGVRLSKEILMFKSSLVLVMTILDEFES